MGLPVLAVLVVLGIALSVAAVHFAGGDDNRDACSARIQALARFAEDFPDEKPGAVRLTADNHAAFVDLGPQRCGIVHSHRRLLSTRIVTPNDILTVTREGNVVSLRLNDFTWKGGSFSCRRS
ncbi:hypothetical protein ACVOMV_13120 [Mesorhizobium atlanticum]